MAKFKVGDRVAHYSDKGNIGKIIEVKTYPAGQISYKVKMPSGIVYEWQEFEMVKNAVCNAKFEVGKVYRAPWDRDWLCKVLSRTDSSVKCAIKSVRDKSWGPNDEIVTLRIQPKQTEQNGSEVIKGQDWEFWADVTNSCISTNAVVNAALEWKREMKCNNSVGCNAEIGDMVYGKYLLPGQGNQTVGVDGIVVDKDSSGYSILEPKTKTPIWVGKDVKILHKKSLYKSGMKVKSRHGNIVTLEEPKYFGNGILKWKIKELPGKVLRDEAIVRVVNSIN